MNINQNNFILSTNNFNLRPYEKCLEFGASALDDAELLAVILRSGVRGMNATELASTILELGAGCAGDDGVLAGLLNLSIPQLLEIKGVGKVKAIQIQCICELSKRISKQQRCSRLDFDSPETIAHYYMQDLRCLEKEHLILVLLDGKCRMIRDCVLSVGTINASLVNPREIFVEALRYSAVHVILLHNHPSGDSTPSRNDLEVTKRIQKAGEIIGINLIDHIIIGDNKYTSLKEKEFM